MIIPKANFANEVPFAVNIKDIQSNFIEHIIIFYVKEAVTFMYSVAYGYILINNTLLAIDFSIALEKLIYFQSACHR